MRNVSVSLKFICHNPFCFNPSGRVIGFMKPISLVIVSCRFPKYVKHFLFWLFLCPVKNKLMLNHCWWHFWIWNEVENHFDDSFCYFVCSYLEWQPCIFLFGSVKVCQEVKRVLHNELKFFISQILKTISKHRNTLNSTSKKKEKIINIQLKKCYFSAEQLFAIPNNDIIACYLSFFFIFLSFFLSFFLFWRDPLLYISTSVALRFGMLRHSY